MTAGGKVVRSSPETAAGYHFYIQPVAAKAPDGWTVLSVPTVASSEEGNKKALNAKGSISDNDGGGKGDFNTFGGHSAILLKVTSL